MSAQITTEQKALRINLDTTIYGTFAEIGAGQEVARCFFRVGGAAGTIAKAMSAYDMKFSDEIYGKTERYVSRERLISMLNHEFGLLTKRLDQTRGETTKFFVFANTVAARNFKGTNECHGWMGVRFQLHPRAEPNDLYIHVRMKDHDALLQQQAIGVLGVNLLSAAYFLREDPKLFVQSLLEELSVDRIEVDMMELSGPDFQHVDNRVVSLRLLQYGLTPAVMLGPEQRVFQPSEVIRKHPVLLLRGSFRPITHLHVDMIKCASVKFEADPAVLGKEPLVILELSIKNLLAGGDLDVADFVSRADSISALGFKVLITDFPEFYLLPSYFRRYTTEPIGIVVGVNHLYSIFDSKFYQHLPGGMLEAVGRLFQSNVRLYAHPMTKVGFERYAKLPSAEIEGELVTVANLPVPSEIAYLYKHLVMNGFLINVEGVNRNYLEIFGQDVLRSMREGTNDWRKDVPEAAAKVIIEKHLTDSKHR